MLPRFTARPKAEAPKQHAREPASRDPAGRSKLSNLDKENQMRKPRLMTPGPAMVPEDVLLELARPVIHHRSNEAKQVVTEVLDGLKEVFQTKNDVLILTASG